MVSFLQGKAFAWEMDVRAVSAVFPGRLLCFSGRGQY